MRLSPPLMHYHLFNDWFSSPATSQVQFKQQELNLARRLLGITARNWVLSSEEGGWVTGRELESQLKLIQVETPFFKLLYLLETRARKEDNLLEILHRLGLWSAEVRLESNTLFLFIPLSVALALFLVLSSTCFIFLFPLHPSMHTQFLCCCLEASSWQCNTSPALFTGPSSGTQEENELYISYSHFPSHREAKEMVQTVEQP